MGLLTQGPLAAPRGLLHKLVARTETVTNIGILAVFVLCVAILIRRWYRATGRVRAQLTWLVCGAVIAVGLFLPTGWVRTNRCSSGNGTVSTLCPFGKAA